jgi:hypothetical protein
LAARGTRAAERPRAAHRRAHGGRRYPSLVRMPMASFLLFPCPDFHGEKTPSHFP